MKLYTLESACKVQLMARACGEKLNSFQKTFLKDMPKILEMLQVTS